ncbi:hypothetical protein MTO96_036531 [Rhipicephalus appendiculatus]
MAVALYNLDKSPPCNFVRSLAKHVGVELNLKNLDFLNNEHLSEEYLKINPFHKVPAIDDGGFVVYESCLLSTAISYYLLRKYAPDSELYPASLKTRTRIDQALACISTSIYSASVAFFMPRVRQKTKPTTEEMMVFERDVLKGLENLIGDGKFAVGDCFTVADLAATARVIVALESFFDPAKFTKLASYYDRVKSEQPYFEEVYRPALNVIKAMKASLK